MEPHERRHQASYNTCVVSGARAADAVAKLEAVVAQDVRAEADNVLFYDLWYVLDQAKETTQTWTVPEGMWHWRHNGTDGCP